ncbi:hypothetical protein Van01_42710 [Micromonospora andamanensis]|uniref:Uncharacterized protein n=1 Tax=Micromonospora andamanensis TaxID=1287068 RepID=A0ABQ4HZJ2_9ACTN|nr:hypothetical protein Van01_42710 [Micromonospora andamanensis]
MLRSEFGCDDGSFLLRLRIELEWDRAAFARMEAAMRVVCAGYDRREASDQWLAEGFHFVSTWVDGHTAHPSFPRPQPESYHTASLDRLRALATWFSRGVPADQT